MSTVAQRHFSRYRSDCRPRPATSPGRIGGLLGDRLGQGLQGLTGKTLDQRADIRGNVTVTSRPALLPTWRLEPNLAGQVSIADASLSILGAKLNVSNEVKPLLDRAVNEQIAALQATRAQRSVPRAHRAARMGQDVPVDPARRGRGRPAEPLARDAADARLRGPAAHRRIRRHADHRRAGRDPDRAVGDQARTARSRRSSSSCRRWTRAASTSRCRSTCRSPRSTGCWRRSSRARPSRRTRAARSPSRSAA